MRCSVDEYIQPQNVDTDKPFIDASRRRISQSLTCTVATAVLERCKLRFADEIENR